MFLDIFYAFLSLIPEEPEANFVPFGLFIPCASQNGGLEVIKTLK